MKTKALNFLKKQPTAIGERFNAAMEIARESKISEQLLQRYNRKGATDANVEALVYDIKKHLNISETDIASHIVPDVMTDAPTDFAPDNSIRKAENLSDLQLDPFRNVLREMNAEEKSGFSYDQRYPFLREKDTPNEFKILTSDAITAFNGYKAKHEKLFAELQDVAEPKLTEEEVFAIANELLGEFEENRDIHEELEHYQQNKEILGEHEIFADLKLEREIAAIEPAKLGQAKANIASNISKKTKALENEKDEARKTELKEAIEFLEKKKKLVDARIKPEAPEDAEK